MQVPSVLSISSALSSAVFASLLVTSGVNAAAAPAPSPLQPSPAAAVSASGNPFSPARTTDKADALDFAIVIPAVARLLENEHPAELRPLTGPATPISALQRVVLVSTLRSGFCMDLRLNPLPVGQAQFADWQVQLAALSGAAAASGARVEAFEGGWRVCARRAGRFELALLHAFSLQPRAAVASVNVAIDATGQTTALGWPVALSLSTP